MSLEIELKTMVNVIDQHTEIEEHQNLYNVMSDNIKNKYKLSHKEFNIHYMNAFCKYGDN